MAAVKSVAATPFTVIAPAESPVSPAVIVMVITVPMPWTPLEGEKDTLETVGLWASMAGQASAAGAVVKAAFSLPAASLSTTFTGICEPSAMSVWPCRIV